MSTQKQCINTHKIKIVNTFFIYGKVSSHSYCIIIHCHGTTQSVYIYIKISTETTGNLYLHAIALSLGMLGEPGGLLGLDGFLTLPRSKAVC